MKPKKSLGQNFLTSEAAIFKIVQAAQISGEKIGGTETILEVGPGRGALTKALLSTGVKVVAVEKDHELIAGLEEKFAREIKVGQLKLIEDDILKVEPDNIDLAGDGYKIVANIPYYITGQFLKKFLSAAHQPITMVILLQKEVVERIIANDEKESIISISVKVYGKPKKITVVNRGSFFPAPNVDSAVVAIENISKDFFDSISEENFFKVIKAGFAHKRKMLVSNLTVIAPRTKILEIFSENNIAPNIRAEDLKIDQWKKITKSLF